MGTSVVLAEMREKEIRPGVILYTVLMDGYGIDKVRVAIALFNEMIERGLEPDAVAYTALLSSCCNRGDVDGAVTLINEMSSKGIEPDTRAIAALHQGIQKQKKKSL